jgi:predicted small lipoprotein YifL
MRRRTRNGSSRVPADLRAAPSRLALAVAVWAVAGGGLAGCGQRGPLYLPENPPERAAGQPPRAGEAPLDEDDDAQESTDRDGGTE